MTTLSDEHLKAALALVDSPSATVDDKIDVLVEIALMLQQKPRLAQDLRHAVTLYDRALALCPSEDQLRAARIRARKATALNALPEDGLALVEQARELFETALEELRRHGSAEEVAETEMNLGLTLHTLAGQGRARISDAIAAYLRALRTFTRESHPAEYAILHNNLATAYLVMPLDQPGARMREALAVQSFEEALKVINLVDHPVEYAMLQNNLGNALQYASSTHALENNLRALAAYDEALKVRTVRDTPLEYANTIANKANALRNLPDDPGQPDHGNARNLRTAQQYLAEAKAIFERHAERGKTALVAEALQDVEADLAVQGRDEAASSPPREETS